MKCLKKGLSGVCLGLLLLTSNALAQEVIVTGFGTDKDSAAKDAMRSAVENVVGTYIDSKTLVEQNTVALDEIYSNSRGFVRNVSILEQGNANGAYYVKARVDVDTNPDGTLMNKMQLLMALNDPRIAVVVLKNTADGTVENDENAETAMNEKLLELGFSHVVDANIVSKLQSSEILNAVYNGERGLLNDSGSLGIDYLILGKAQPRSQKISLPNRYGDYNETMLFTGTAQLNVKIIKFDTGDIIGTFSVDAKAVDNSNDWAQDKALKEAAVNAAEKLEEKFRRLQTHQTGGVQLHISCNDPSKVEELKRELGNISGVNNVYLREQNGSKFIIELDTLQSPGFIVSSLRRNSRLNIVSEGVSNAKANISVF